MNRILVVCLLALTLVITLGLVLAAQPMKDSVIANQAAPPMQKGITVEMPATTNAVSMPDADQPSALIVTVTRDGEVYLGAARLDPDALGGELRDHSSTKTVYIKADARASYATVIKILDAATRAGFEKTVLLTSQDGSPQPGTVSPPQGFTMVTGGCLAAHRPKLSL